MRQAVKALLVEDNRADVGLVRVALEDAEMPVELFVADDGVKALEFLKRSGGRNAPPRPDFVLLDLKLPRKGGLEVLSEMKRDPDLRRIPVIVLTSSTAPGDIARAYELQAAAYFTKSVSGFDDVLAAILAFIGAAELPGKTYEAFPAGGRFTDEATTMYPSLPTASEDLADLPREHQLAALVDSLVDAVVSMTLDGTITTWNRAAEELYGYTADEAIGQSIELIAPEAGLADLAAARAAVRAGEHVGAFDTVRVDRHGRRLDVSSSASPVHDRQGSIVGLSLVSRDITARKSLEERWHLAFEWAPDASVMVDADGRIIAVNNETERLFGYPREELIGWPVEMLVPERFREGHVGDRRRFLAQPEARAMGAGRELHGLRKDGSEFPAQIGLTPIQSAQGSLVLSSVVDITARKHGEEIAAQQTRDLARSNAELEQFAYVASHDLKEPLRTVASYTQLLERRYAAQLDDDARTFIQFARDGVLRMQQLLDGLLAYSRVGTQVYDPKPIDAGRTIETALKNLKFAVDQSGAEVVWDLLPTVTVDPTRLVELFENLIGNAIKYAGESGPRVQIAANRQDPAWVFSVADRGIGIDPVYFDRIFQMFQRLHTRDEYPGTGIGLATCKRIVEGMGGRIWVESTPGQGSTFFFTVPDQSPAG